MTFDLVARTVKNCSSLDLLSIVLVESVWFFEQPVRKLEILLNVHLPHMPDDGFPNLYVDRMRHNNVLSYNPSMFR